VSGTLTFAPNVPSMVFRVPVIDNTVLDGSRSVNLALTNPAGPGAVLGARAEATLTITDNDSAGTFRFSQSMYSVGEGMASMLITVMRSGTNLAGNVTVSYAATGGTATPGADYTVEGPGTLTFGPGQMSRTFTVSIVNDSIAEGPETVELALSSPSSGATLGTPKVATLTINDNDL
jgi:Calx-beta domain